MAAALNPPNLVAVAAAPDQSDADSDDDGANNAVAVLPTYYNAVDLDAHGNPDPSKLWDKQGAEPPSLGGVIPSRTFDYTKDPESAAWQNIFNEVPENDPNQSVANYTVPKAPKLSKQEESDLKAAQGTRPIEHLSFRQAKNEVKAGKRTGDLLENLYTQIAVNNTRWNNKSIILSPETTSENSKLHAPHPIVGTAEYYLEKLIKDTEELTEPREMPKDGSGVFRDLEDLTYARHFRLERPGPHPSFEKVKANPNTDPSAVYQIKGNEFPPVRRSQVTYKVSSAAGGTEQRVIWNDFPRNLFFRMEDGKPRTDVKQQDNYPPHVERDRVLPLKEIKGKDAEIHRNPLHISVLENDATMVNKFLQLCNCWRDKVSSDTKQPDDEQCFSSRPVIPANLTLAELEADLQRKTPSLPPDLQIFENFAMKRMKELWTFKVNSGNAGAADADVEANPAWESYFALPNLDDFKTWWRSQHVAAHKNKIEFFRHNGNKYDVMQHFMMWKCAGHPSIKMGVDPGSFQRRLTELVQPSVIHKAMIFARDHEEQFLAIVNYAFDKHVVGVTKHRIGPVLTNLRRGPMICPAVNSSDPWYGKLPTDNEESPDNQYAILRKDARPWNHCCMAPDRFLWILPSKKPDSIEGRLEWDACMGSRDAPNLKMPNIGDPWEWWQAVESEADIFNLDDIDPRAKDTAFPKSNMWKTDIERPEAGQFDGRHGRHPYVVPYTPIHLAAVYNSDRAMRELLKHWLTWRPYHDLQADWDDKNGLWGCSQNNWLKKEIQFLSGMVHCTSLPTGHKTKLVSSATLVNDPRWLPGGVLNPDDQLLEQPEEIKAMLDEEDIPLWRHTHYHDHSTIGDARWQSLGNKTVGEGPSHANPHSAVLFSMNLKKRERMASHMRNHRMYLLEGVLFTGFHTHVRPFGHLIEPAPVKPPIFGGLRNPMTPYQLSPLQLAAKQDNIEIARVLLHEIAFLVLEGEQLQYEAAYRQLVFPDEPARVYQVHNTMGITNLPKAWAWPKSSGKREAMCSSPFVADLLGKDNYPAKAAPLFEDKLKEKWEKLMRQEYDELRQRNNPNHPIYKKHVYTPKSKSSLSWMRNHYVRGIPWDNMYIVPTKSTGAYEVAVEPDYKEELERLGEFDFMHVFGAAHQSTSKQQSSIFGKSKSSPTTHRVRVRTALDIAVYWGYFDMAEYLINTIVDLRRKDILKQLSDTGYRFPQADLINVLKNASEVNDIRRISLAGKSYKQRKTNYNEDNTQSKRRRLAAYLKAAIKYPYVKDKWITTATRGCIPTKGNATMHKNHVFDFSDPFKANKFAKVVNRLLRPPKDFEAYKAKTWQAEDDSSEDEDE